MTEYGRRRPLRSGSHLLHNRHIPEAHQQTRHRVFLHKLGHIDTDHRLSLSNIKFASALQSSVFPTPVGRGTGMNQSGDLDPPAPHGSTNSVRYRINRFVLTNNAMVSSCSIRSSFSRSLSIMRETGSPSNAPELQQFRHRSLYYAKTHSFAFELRCDFQLLFQFRILPYCSSDIRARSPTRRACS